MRTWDSIGRSWVAGGIKDDLVEKVLENSYSFFLDAVFIDRLL